MSCSYYAREIRSFVALPSYYRSDVPHFAELAAPLHHLTRHNEYRRIRLEILKNLVEHERTRMKEKQGKQTQ